MLYHYLDHKRKESSAQVHATYLVSGKFVDNGQTVRTVLDNNLNATLCLCWWCCSSGSPGVCCQRRPVGRCVTMHLLSCCTQTFGPSFPLAEETCGCWFVLQTLNPGWARPSVSTFTACRKPYWRTAVRSTASIMMPWRTICRTAAGCGFTRPHLRHIKVPPTFWHFMPLPISRYGAVRCSSAVPMSSLELQQARGARQALPPEPEQKKSSANTDTNVVSKPPRKPQKGIMGMFASKAAPKAQESSRGNKSEQEEAAQVWFCHHWVLKGILRGAVLFSQLF